MPNDHLEFPTPLGTVKASGKDIFMWSLILILVGCVAWLVYFSIGKWGEPFDIQNALTSHAENSQNQHTENAFILSVCLNQHRQDECSRINLQMPESLRKKLKQADP